jgi:RNA-binding protein
MLNAKQRALLRGIAAKEEAIYQIGKDGLTPTGVEGILQALTARELVKISVNPASETDAKTLAEQLSARIKADVVAVIGRKIILYKYSATAKRHIDINVADKKVKKKLTSKKV